MVVCRVIIDKCIAADEAGQDGEDQELDEVAALCVVFIVTTMNLFAGCPDEGTRRGARSV